MSDRPFARILLYYSIYQDAYKDLGEHIEFYEGVPQPKDNDQDSRSKLLILDDLMNESSDSSIILDLFTKASHHYNLCVFFTFFYISKLTPQG